MTGTPNIAGRIPKAHRTLAARGLPDDSYFEVEFEDGSVVTEHEVDWSAFADSVRVEGFGFQKAASVAQFRVKRLTVFHEGLSTTLEVPAGAQVYQAVRAESVVGIGVQRRDRILGRVLGIVQDGRIVEERFVDGTTGEITGLRR